MCRYYKKVMWLIVRGANIQGTHWASMGDNVGRFYNIGTNLEYRFLYFSSRNIGKSFRCLLRILISMGRFSDVLHCNIKRYKSNRGGRHS